MVFVLLTYGGWNEAAYISAEVHGGPRAIVRALVLSLLIITIVYVVFVLAVLKGLGFAGMAKSSAVGADVMQAAFGPVGAQLIGAIVGVATLTSINATMIVGARTNYALGRDWPILGFMGAWHGERNVPVVAFLVQAAIALALIAFGALQKDGFTAMVEFTAPVFWFFFLLTGVALFVLRFRAPHTARPFKVPMYPILPIVFVLTCAYLLYSSVTYAQSQNAVHVAFYVMGAGVLAWASHAPAGWRACAPEMSRPDCCSQLAGARATTRAGAALSDIDTRRPQCDVTCYPPGGSSHCRPAKWRGRHRS